MHSNWLFGGLYASAAMIWDTLWALVLGFAVSGFVQAFVPRSQMERVLGGNGFRPVGMATLFGAASSSCSYAATAAARSAFGKGAGFVPTVAFMLASTNLVFEIGAILWVLMGWRFVLGELVGAVVMIGFMWAIVTLTMPKGLVDEARKHADAGEDGGCCHHHDHHDMHGMNEEPAGLQKAGSAFVSDIKMLWKEILIGMLVAGFLSVLVPNAWWQALFLTGGNPVLRDLENALVGPILSMLSFACSCANIPLAATIWSGGSSFGGVLSFIYGDLIVIPIIVIYGKYYGWRMATYLTACLYVSMALAGLVVQYLFNLTHLIPSNPPAHTAMTMDAFCWNYTTWLDLLAIAVWIALFLAGRGKASTHCH